MIKKPRQKADLTVLAQASGVLSASCIRDESRIQKQVRPSRSLWALSRDSSLSTPPHHLFMCTERVRVCV